MILAKTMTKPTHEPPYARTQRCGQAVAEEARAAIATANEATRRLRAIMRSSSRASSSTPCTHQRLAHLLAMASLRDDCVAVPPAKGRDYSRPALAHRATSRFPSPPHPRRSRRTRHPGRPVRPIKYHTIQLYSTPCRTRGGRGPRVMHSVPAPWLSYAPRALHVPGIRKAGHSAMEQRSYTSVTASGVVCNVSVLCRATRVHSVSISSGEHVNRSSTANLPE